MVSATRSRDERPAEKRRDGLPYRLFAAGPEGVVVEGEDDRAAVGGEDGSCRTAAATLAQPSRRARRIDRRNPLQRANGADSAADLERQVFAVCRFATGAPSARAGEEFDDDRIARGCWCRRRCLLFSLWRDRQTACRPTRPPQQRS